MAVATGCPDHERLRQLLLGQLAPAEADTVGQHLNLCTHCGEVVQVLPADDLLVMVARASATLPDHPDREQVTNLIDQLKRLRPSGSTAARELPTDPPTQPSVEGGYEFLVPPQGPDEIGRLGPYRVRRVLGVGGMGIVFEAFDPQLKRSVALKVLKPGLASSTAARQRFLREAEVMAATEHEHIIAIHQVGEEGGIPFLAMPLLHGETLEQRLKRDGRLPLAEALRIGRETAQGLAAAHARGLIHRDIKPANVFLVSGGVVSGEWSEGSSTHHSPLTTHHSPLTTHHSPLTTHHSPTVKILDFGLARLAEDDAHLSQVGIVVGTPQYMAPEQAEGGSVDARSDLFSLGCVLYRLCTGQLPFPGSGTLGALRALAVGQPIAPRNLAPELPPALADLILRLLARAPKDRPQTAHAVVATLTAIEQQQTEQRPRRLRRWLTAAAVAALVLLSALGYRQWPLPSRSPADREQAADVGQVAEVRRPAAASPPALADKAEPFVVLAPPDRVAHQRATLAEAVALAASGDTIEVHGNGPFVSGCIHVAGKALTIRAAAGFRPVLRVSPDAPNACLLRTDAALTLEGLEIQRIADGRATAAHVIRCTSAPVRIANCRFLVHQKPMLAVILAGKAPRVEVRNCEFFSGSGVNPVHWSCPSGGRMVLENNVMASESGGGGEVMVTWRDAGLRDVSLALVRNTLALRPLRFVLETDPVSSVGPGGKAVPPLRVEACDNVFHTPDTLLLLRQGQAQAGGEGEAQLLRLAAWHERRNVYSEGTQFLQWGDSSVLSQPTWGSRGLAGWQQFWGQAETGSRQGRIRFQGGDVRSQLTAALTKAAAADYRLDAGSAGFRVGEGGADLGADVTLVGPGPAYERWQQTPAYRQWRNDGGHVK